MRLLLQADEPLAKFLDYCTYGHMIDNVVLIVTGTLHERDVHVRLCLSAQSIAVQHASLIGQQPLPVSTAELQALSAWAPGSVSSVWYG